VAYLLPMATPMMSRSSIIFVSASNDGLRLCKFFGLSEGYFLWLQNCL
jgi:hypothetical protein